MNTSNQKLTKGIKIFFKTINIIILVFIGFILLSQTLMFTVFKDLDVGSLPVLLAVKEPCLTLDFNGESHKILSIISISGIAMHGVPTWMKISNALFLLLSLSFYFFIIRNIRFMVKSIEKAEVFTLLNARRLRNIGLLLILDVLLSNTLMIVNSISVGALGEGSIIGVLSTTFGKSAGYLVAIVFTFFIAAVFKIGISIQQENQSFV